MDKTFQKTVYNMYFWICNDRKVDLKLTQEDYDNIMYFMSIHNNGFDYSNAERTKVLRYCADQGFYPAKDKIYELIGIGITDLPNSFYDIIDKNSCEYFVVMIKIGKFNITQNKKVKFDYDEEQKKQIKKAIFGSIIVYTETELRNLKNMFQFDYDQECMDLLINSENIAYRSKMYKELIKNDIKPTYEDVVKFVMKHNSKGTLKKFFY